MALTKNRADYRQSISLHMFPRQLLEAYFYSIAPSPFFARLFKIDAGCLPCYQGQIKRGSLGLTSKVFISRIGDLRIELDDFLLPWMHAIKTPFAVITKKHMNRHGCCYRSLPRGVPWLHNGTAEKERWLLKDDAWYCSNERWLVV